MIFSSIFHFFQLNFSHFSISLQQPQSFHFFRKHAGTQVRQSLSFHKNLQYDKHRMSCFNVELSIFNSKEEFLTAHVKVNLKSS